MSSTLSRAELTEGLRTAEDFGFKVADPDALSAVFDELDADKNDCISWKEFVRVRVCDVCV